MVFVHGLCLLRLAHASTDYKNKKNIETGCTPGAECMPKLSSH